MTDPDSINRRRRIDYETTFSSQAGERVLRDLFTRFIASYNWTPGEPMENAIFREGQRSVILDILYFMGAEADPKRFMDQVEQARQDYDPEL